MGTLYERIAQLCTKRDISAYRLCKDIGIQPSVITDLKKGRKSGLSAKNADKIASYFGVSVGYLLGTEAETKSALTPKEKRRVDDEDMMFALWGDTSEVSKEDLEDVKRYAAFIRDRKKKHD